MALKKSLGHSPFGESDAPISYTDFGFIADRSDLLPKPAEEQLVWETPVPEAPAVRELHSVGLEEKETAEPQKLQKKVASYYLEEPTIHQVREFAEKTGESYSGVVQHILKHFFQRL
ncbi:MAG: hypothetical protein ACNA78_05830 [Balneolaceae bacterium]